MLQRFANSTLVYCCCSPAVSPVLLCCVLTAPVFENHVRVYCMLVSLMQLVRSHIQEPADLSRLEQLRRRLEGQWFVFLYFEFLTYKSCARLKRANCVAYGIFWEAICTQHNFTLSPALPWVFANTPASAVAVLCLFRTGDCSQLSQGPLFQTSSYSTWHLLVCSEIHLASVKSIGCTVFGKIEWKTCIL